MEKRFFIVTETWDVVVYMLRRKSAIDAFVPPKPAPVHPPVLVPLPVAVSRQPVSQPAIRVRRLIQADVRRYVAEVRRPSDRVCCYGCGGTDGCRFYSVH